jgi:hypothetical protein
MWNNPSDVISLFTTTERSITAGDISTRNDTTGRHESSLLIQSSDRLRMIEEGKSRQ